jgi:hypothetical protein
LQVCGRRGGRLNAEAAQDRQGFFCRRGQKHAESDSEEWRKLPV